MLSVDRGCGDIWLLFRLCIVSRSSSTNTISRFVESSLRIRYSSYFSSYFHHLPLRREFCQLTRHWLLSFAEFRNSSLDSSAPVLSPRSPPHYFAIRALAEYRETCLASSARDSSRSSNVSTIADTIDSVAKLQQHSSFSATSFVVLTVATDLEIFGNLPVPHRNRGTFSLISGAESIPLKLSRR